MVWLWNLSPIPWLQLKIGQLKGSMKQCQCRRFHFPKIFGPWTTFNSRFSMQHPMTRSCSLVTSIQLEPNFQCSNTWGEAGWTFRQQGRLWVKMFCHAKNQSHQIVIHILRCKHCSVFSLKVAVKCCHFQLTHQVSGDKYHVYQFATSIYLLSLAT